MLRFSGILTLVAVATAFPVSGQTPYYEFSVSDVAAAPSGGRYFQSVDLTVLNHWNVQSWSFGVCHDSTVTDIRGAETTQFVIDLNLIGPLFFQAQAIVNRSMNVPGSSDGAVQGIVIDQCSLFGFPNNSTATVLRMEYLADPGIVGANANTFVCEAVGSPIVGVSVQWAQLGGVTLTPGTVQFVPNQPQWTLGGYDVSAHCPGGGAPCNALVPIDIANTVHNTISTDTAGFSIAVVHDSTLLTPVTVQLGPTVAALDHGAGPAFVTTNVSPAGVAIEVQNTAFPHIPVLPYNLEPIDWGSGDTAIIIEYEVAPSAIGTTTTLDFDDVGGVENGLLIKPVGNQQVFTLLGGNNLDLAPVNVAIDYTPFVRGACSDAGTFNIAEVVYVLNYLFPPTSTSTTPPCMDACDANDDGVLTLADPVRMLTALFGTPTARLADPIGCAPDPTADGLDCVSHTGC